MKNRLIVLVGLSILLCAWSVFAYTSHTQASEPTSLKTATLRIEGMT